MFGSSSDAAVAVMLALGFVEARFGQENPPVEKKINDLVKNVDIDFKLQNIPVVLLAAADPCDYAKLADSLIDKSKSNKMTQDQRDKMLKLAQEFVKSEHNFDPTAGPKKPKFCNDPALPKTQELRGILPLADPKLKDAGKFNTKVNDLLKRALSGDKSVSDGANGLSVQDQVLLAGFSDCVGCDQAAVDAAKGRQPGGSSSPTSTNNNSTSSASPAPGSSPAASVPAAEAATTGPSNNVIQGNGTFLVISSVSGSAAGQVDGLAQLKDICSRL